jgi:nucleoside-diphosphate-sugar epimerase
MLTRSRAKYVVCAAGISGKPTIQWSEDHEPETFETNLLDVCNLIRLCRDRGRHLTYLGSGLVYSSASADKLASDSKRAGTVAATTAAAAASSTTVCSDVAPMAPRTEREQPDLVAKVYCRYRVMLEDIIRRVYPTDLLYLRLIYPCTFDGHPKCFFQKMLGRTSNVNNVAVSLTVVPDLFPLLPTLIEEKRATGILNFVSPGAIELPALLATAGVRHSVAPTPSTPLASEVLCTHKLCELVDGDAASNTGKASKIPSLAESMPHYVARYLKLQEVQEVHHKQASHGTVGARAWADEQES